MGAKTSFAAVDKFVVMSEPVRVAILLVMSSLVYGNTLLNGFAMDDFFYIFNNPLVTNPTFKGFFTVTRAGNVFRPFTFATLAINWLAGGAHPWGYHLVNLLLHALVTVLVYLTLRKFLEGMVTEGPLMAWVAAMLFAVHPIHTEAVSSIVGRSELLAVGFLLAAWLLHLQDWPIAALVCFLLALMGKESAVIFLPLSLAGDFALGKWKSLARYGWIAGLGALYLAVLWKMQGGHFGEKGGINFLDNPLAQLPPRLRIANALRVAWKYIGLHVYPAQLSCDYSYNAILLYSNWRHTLPPLIATAVVLALWIWAIVTRRKEWYLAGAVYLVGFSVTANLLMPTGTIMGERLAYLPSVGFCLLFALIWMRLEKRQRGLAWTLLAVVLVALGARTVVRNRDWQDNFSLFSSAVQAAPGSAKVHAGLGGEYLRRDELEAARKEYLISLSIYPDFPDVVDSLGLLEARLGHDQEALRLFEKSLSMIRKDDVLYEYVAANLAEQLIKLGKTEDALKLLNGQIAASPEYSRNWSIRAVIWYQRGEWESVRADTNEALRLDPSNSQALLLFALLNKATPLTARP